MFNVMISKQQKKSVSTSNARLLHIQSLIFDSICSLQTPHFIWPDTSSDTRTLTVLGWTDDIRILSATLYPDHVQKNTPQFMTALFNIGRVWLGAATILPPKHIHDLDDTIAQDPDKIGRAHV